VAEHFNDGRDRPDDPPRASEESPAGDRRAKHRVRDDQQSGQGSLTALSKMKMMERRRAAMRPIREED
jgi:hypothetical protein